MGSCKPAAGALALAVLLAGCASNIAYAPAGSFDFSGRQVPITRETFDLAASDGTRRPQERFFVVSNGERYNCDGTPEDCRKIYRRAEERPRGFRSRF